MEIKTKEKINTFLWFSKILSLSILATFNVFIIAILIFEQYNIY